MVRTVLVKQRLQPPHHDQLSLTANGSKYFGLRGIAADVALIEKWDDMQELCRSHSRQHYDTVIIDQLKELMEKLIAYMRNRADSKLWSSGGGNRQWRAGAG